MRTRFFGLVWAIVWVVACGGPPNAPTTTDKRDPAQLFAQALRHEAEHPLDAKGYLAVVEHALLSADDPFALASLAAALDALVWRDVKDLGGIDHAVVHRSGDALKETSRRLRGAYASGFGTPLMRGLVADALHELALLVGADKAAAKWRTRAGCVPRAALAGPLAWPGLTALETKSPTGAHDPMPKGFDGIKPFATRANFDTVVADACTLPIDETSPLMGLRLVVVDIDNPRAQKLYVSLSSSNATVLEIGGKTVITRPFSAGGEWVTRFGQVDAEAGRLRLLLRVAHRHDGNNVGLQLWDEKGEPVQTMVPRQGDRAPAKATAAAAIPLAPKPGAHQLVAAVGGLLAVGEARQAMNVLEADDTGDSLELDLLRVRALEDADHIPRNQRRMQVSPAAARAATRCASCWEARIYDASAEEDRKGYGVGVYAAFAKLGVTAEAKTWTESLDAMQLVYVAVQASSAGLGDIARAAYDALALKAPGSVMLADLDQRLHERLGSDDVQASCKGGTSRASTRCLQAHITRSDLASSLAEMERLRSLRGSKAILRNIEIAQLLAHDKTDQAMLIYDALPPASRELSLLGLYVGTPDEAAGKRRFADNMLHASDAPHGYEPLARLLGAFEDPSFTLEKEGAAIVSRDREKAFLPGAGTAVLRRLEHYDLRASGLLHYWVYDLRRVSGTIDVASGTWMGTPHLEGRGTSRSLRRRIYKKDGRVLDTDPNARGAQGNTDLAQLQTGDYVEALVVGWALPDDNGQLTVDTPDLLPPRTSVRQGQITFRRPRAIPVSLWSHATLGEGDKKDQGADIVTTWKLDNRAPRRLESGVPPLEARAAISFGTDSYQRIARALGAHHRTLDENDVFMAKWVKSAIGDETDPHKKLARIVAAAGKALKRSDAAALGDWAASLGGGAQRETARMMVERGVGSRTWLVHRALREIGVNNEIVVSEAEPFSAAPGFPPHTGRFTHPLIRADLDGKKVWIDADVDGPPLPPGRISPELRGRKALLVDGTMITVEVESSADIDEIAIDLELANNGDATGSVALTLFGRPAQALVEAFEVVVGSRRDQMLRGVVLAWVPWADVQSVQLASDETSWEVRVTAKIKIVGFARPEQRDQPIYSLPGMTALHTVMPAASGTLSARYNRQGDRKTALAIDTPLLYRVKRSITLPPAAKVIARPSSLLKNEPYIRAQRLVAQANNVLTDVFLINLPVGTIDPTMSDAFVNTVQTIDDSFMHTTRIELTSN